MATILGPVLDTANAFFGAFFGFWVAIYFTQLDNIACPLHPSIQFCLMVIILLAFSLQIIGLYRCLELGPDPSAKSFFKKFWINIVSFVLFIATLAVMTNIVPEVTDKSLHGIVIYGWWIGLTAIVSLYLR